VWERASDFRLSVCSLHTMRENEIENQNDAPRPDRRMTADGVRACAVPAVRVVFR
jgi:hypothetical protein